MLLKALKAVNFKNIGETQIVFAPKLNCLLGNNGMGKSNLLDAIYYLSFCKSFTGAVDKMLVRTGQDFAMLTADYRRRGEDTTVNVALWQNGRRKSFKRDGKEYQRLSAHIGMFPAVLVSPADLDLVVGAGEERRRFIDMSISQSNPVYLDHLLRYNHSLTQRNRLLRDGCEDPVLYGALEAAMAHSARYITEARRRHITDMADIHRTYYKKIAPAPAETTGIEYIPCGGDNLLDELERSRQRDHILKHTTVGPHRDDINFTLNDMPLRRTGSQGQQKTFTIALRLAQYQFVRQSADINPLLLLDDIFDKLDSHRVNAIISIVRNDDFGQIFITDTNRQHLRDMLEGFDPERAIWSVSDGTFTPIDDIS